MCVYSVYGCTIYQKFIIMMISTFIHIAENCSKLYSMNRSVTIYISWMEPCCIRWPPPVEMPVTEVSD